jgi:hypothetical protein
MSNPFLPLLPEAAETQRLLTRLLLTLLAALARKLMML